MRAVLLDDLKDEHAECPRPTKKPMSDFYEADLTRRPVFGIHKLARLTEHYLHRAKFGKVANRRLEGDADALFFEVRQVIRNLVHNHKATDRMSAAETNALRKRVASLLSDCRKLDDSFGQVGRCVCPCCRGTGRMYKVTAGSDKAVKAILDKAVEEGRLGFSRALGYYGI